MKREDLKMIAVLAIPNPKQPESKSLGRQRVQSMNSISSLVTATSDDEFAIGKPPFIPSRKSSLGEEEEWHIQTPSGMTMQQATHGMTNPEMLQQSSHSIDSSQPQSPARIQYLYNKPHNHTRKQRRAVVVHSDAVSFLVRRNQPFDILSTLILRAHVYISRFLGYQPAASLWRLQRMAQKGKQMEFQLLD